MRATIKDIAAIAGTSTATVSLALNGSDSRISEGTRERIVKIAKELNYRPNQAAVNLKLNKSRTVGLIVPDIRNDFYSYVAKGFEDACRRSGVSVMLCNTGDSYERETEYIEVLDSKGIDGIVVSMSSTGNREKAEKTLELLTARGIPFVLLDATAAKEDMNFVTIDSARGGALVAGHLRSLGHERIAVITGPLYLSGVSERLDGFLAAYTAEGAAFDKDLLVESDYSFEGGRAACERLLKKGGFSAIFAFNDMMAIGAYGVLRANGLHVPQDVSLVGFDDIFAASIIDVPLTTVRQPMYTMGERAAQVLCELTDGKAGEPQLIRYTPELIVRASTAACSGTINKR